jgi:hypothetical protein
LDYRIIHSAGNAITHKSKSGTYQAFAIDIGCYAHLRKLGGKFKELDVSSRDMKEKLRSSPILTHPDYEKIFQRTPDDVERTLLEDEE